MQPAMIEVRSPQDRDDALAPTPGGVTNGITYEPADGADVMFAVATGMRVRIVSGGREETPLVLREAKITIFVTDSRIAFACTHYDKGGGWYGTSMLVLPFNAVSKALARRRSSGSTLTGQVRYAWLAAVGGSEKRGGLDSEQLRIVAHQPIDGGFATVYLDFTLPKDVSGPAVAAETARRAARFRLAAGDGRDDADDLASLHELAGTGTVPSQRGSFGLHTFPGWWPVSSASVDLKALIARSGSATPPPAVDTPKPAPPAAVADWSAVFDDGRCIDLDGLTLFGRNPAADPSDVDTFGPSGITLVAIVDESMTVSKTHLSVAVVDGRPVAVDRHSTNGSAVWAAEGPASLAPGEGITLTDGQRVTMGDRSFTVRRNAAPHDDRPAMPRRWTLHLDDGQEADVAPLTLLGRAPGTSAEEARHYGAGGVRRVPLQGEGMAPTHVAVCLQDVPVLIDRSGQWGVTVTSGDTVTTVGPHQQVTLADGDSVFFGGRTVRLAAGEAAPGQPRIAKPPSPAARPNRTQQAQPTGRSQQRPRLPAKPIAIIAGVVIIVLIGGYAWSHRATSQAQVCGDYGAVWKELDDPASLVYGNPVFDAVGDLSSSAARYNGADLSTDAAALQRIADSDSTDEDEISSAMPNIAVMCGGDLD